MNKKLSLAIGIFVVVLVVVFFIRNNTPINESYGDSSQATLNENTIVLNQDSQTATIPNDDNDDVEDDDGVMVDMSKNPQTNTNPSSSTGITQSELAKHNSKDDCWVVYNNKVYDVTSYIPRHPGGEQRIARTCGTLDFESDFTRQHGTSKVNLLMKVGTFIGDFDVVGNLT